MDVEREVLSVGLSLWPVLLGGRRIRPAQRSPQEGEVAVYRVGSHVRAHRVLKRTATSLLVRGDNPSVPLERVAVEEVLGVWQPTGVLLRLALGPTSGKVIGPLTLAAGRTSLAPIAKWLADRLPSAGVSGFRVEVATTPPQTLAVELGGLGLIRPLRSVAEIAAWLGRGSGFAVLARRHSRVVGGMRALPQDDGLLLAIALKRRYRGQGLGQRLLDAAIAEARRRDAGRLLADIRRDNVASLRLFQGAGFTRIEEAVLVAPGVGVLFDRYALDLG